MSDEELMLEARRFEKNLLNFFWRQGVSLSEGEDLVQETYLRFWKYRDEYVPRTRLSTFLFLIARQVRIDALRRSSRRARREDLWGKSQTSVQQPDGCEGEDIRWAVTRLSFPLKEVIELAVFQDLPYAEVAAILGIPIGTVKSRMSNALKKLKEIFDES